MLFLYPILGGGFMTPFEKALIKELTGIRKELHELNKPKEEAVADLTAALSAEPILRQVKVDGQTASQTMRK